MGCRGGEEEISREKSGEEKILSLWVRKHCMRIITSNYLTLISTAEMKNSKQKRYNKLN